MSEKKDISEIRKTNLKNMLSSFKNQREMADAIGMSSGQLNHLLTGFRGIGEKLARKIELALRIPECSLDADAVNVAFSDDESKLPIESLAVTPEELGFINLLRDITSSQRKNAYEIIKDFKNQNKMVINELSHRYNNHAHA